MNLICSYYQIPLRKREIQIKTEFNVPDEFVIKSDPNRFTQIINNLISNAIKFTKKGSITLGINFDIKSPDRVEFFIKDTGVGMKSSDLKKLFKKFGKIEDELELNT